MNGMSYDAIPEYDPVSGYPVSSPQEGAEKAEAPPASNDESRHEPPPGSPRWNEIYRNWKDEARQNEELARHNEELERRLSELETRQTYQPSAPQPQPGVEDETAWLREIIREETAAATAPIQQAFQSQMQERAIQQKAAEFRASHPEYDDARDRAILIHTMRRYNTDNFDAGYRIAFPERIVGQTRQDSSPVADVPGTTAHVPAESPEALMARFNDPSCSAQEKAIIAMKIADSGGWGAAAAEKALGF